MIYQISPYSDSDPAVREQRFQAACAFAARLLLEGRLVYSPVVHGHPLVQHGLPVDWSFWERYDRQHLERCDEVIVLKLAGWQESVGVQAELRHASVLEKPVRFIEPDGRQNADSAGDRSQVPHPSVRGLFCSTCGSDRLRVVYTRDMVGGIVQRRRECRDCQHRVTTWERIVPSSLHGCNKLTRPRESVRQVRSEQNSGE